MIEYYRSMCHGIIDLHAMVGVKYYTVRGITDRYIRSVVCIMR